MTAAAPDTVSSRHGVNSSPRLTGNTDWNTIAPATLPSASTSFPRRAQITLAFIASGSSVATGATSSENISSETPSAEDRCSTTRTNSSAPTIRTPSAKSVWVRDRAIGGGDGRRNSRANRSIADLADRLLPLPVPGRAPEAVPHVDAVAHQQERDQARRAARRRARSRRRTPRRTSPGRTACPAGSRRGRARSRVTRLPRRAPTNTVIANAQNARVDSMNGAPRIAPIPISLPAACPPKIATSGSSVSGNAVPIAARTEPTAPSDRPKPSPTHSTPFVKSSAPPRITTSDSRRSSQSMRRPMLPGVLGCRNRWRPPRTPPSRAPDRRG